MTQQIGNHLIRLSFRHLKRFRKYLSVDICSCIDKKTLFQDSAASILFRDCCVWCPGLAASTLPHTAKSKPSNTLKRTFLVTDIRNRQNKFLISDRVGKRIDVHPSDACHIFDSGFAVTYHLNTPSSFRTPAAW